MEAEQSDLNAPANVFGINRAGNVPPGALPFEKRAPGPEPVSIPLDGRSPTQQIPLYPDGRPVETASPKPNFYQSPPAGEMDLPAPSLPEPAPIETPQAPLPLGHERQYSAWHGIEVDETGHAVQNPALAYGQEFHREQRAEAPMQMQNDEEVAAASGQLAVGTSGSVELPAVDPGASAYQPQSQKRSSSLANRIETTLREGRQLLGANSSLVIDVLLWGIVIVVYIAVIAAIRS